MKYYIENQLDLFEFHDSEFTLISLNNDDLIVSVKHLNIHKNSIPNPSDYDMEIDKAIITFKDFHITTCNFHSFLDETTNYSEQEATEKFKEEFKGEYSEHINIFDLGMLDNSISYIDASGNSPFFSLRFTYDNVIIEWDEYIKKAWYELFKEPKQKDD